MGYHYHPPHPFFHLSTGSNVLLTFRQHNLIRKFWHNMRRPACAYTYHNTPWSRKPLWVTVAGVNSARTSTATVTHGTTERIPPRHITFIINYTFHIRFNYVVKTPGLGFLTLTAHTHTLHNTRNHMRIHIQADHVSVVHAESFESKT